MHVDDGEELKSSSDLLQNYFFVLAVLMLLHQVCYKNFSRGIIYFERKHDLYILRKFSSRNNIFPTKTCFVQHHEKILILRGSRKYYD